MVFERFFKLVATAAVFGFMLADAGQVQGQGRLADADGPSEVPPSSYGGKQYVDSRGCVFVRAGVDGATVWVPRVNRSRQQVCGFKPTLAEAPKPAPKPKPAAPKVAAKPAAQPAAKPVVRAQVATPAARPAARSQARTPAPITTPRRVAVRKPIATIAKPRPAQVKTARPAPAQPVRQKTVLVPARPGAVSPTARIVPRHVWEKRQAEKPAPKVPAGYDRAWDDDRLNGKRTNQTLEGHASTDLIWTRSVPRRLIDRKTGRDVTARTPRLYYPFTDLKMQRVYMSSKDRYQVQVSHGGRVRLVERPGYGRTQGRTVRAVAPARAPVVAKPVVPMRQTRVEPRKVQRLTKPAPAIRGAAPAAMPGHRFVQVGTFGVPANADRTAARLRSAGLPVAVSRVRRGGKQYKVVLAGPFRSRKDLQWGLTAAHRAGFHDAFTRN